MGDSIILLCNLMILSVVIGVAAMPHSADDMDVSSMNEGQIQERFSNEDDKDMPLERRSSEGLFKIKVYMGRQVHQAGSWGNISLQVEFASGHKWPGFAIIGKDMWGDTTYEVNVRTLYCGAGDHVAKVHICNSNKHDGFSPSVIHVYSPDHRRCGYDNCNWDRQCAYSNGAWRHRCLIYGCSPQQITCTHLGNRCSGRTC